MKLSKVKSLIEENKINESLEILQDLAMREELIKDYEVLIPIKKELESYLSERWNVSVKQIQDMSCQRFAESVLFDRYLNKYFFNENNIRGIGYSPDWNANPQMEDYTGVNDFLSKVYFKKESNSAMKDYLYIMDKKTRRVVTTLRKPINDIKEIENSELKSNELLIDTFYKNKRFR